MSHPYQPWHNPERYASEDRADYVLEDIPEDDDWDEPPPPPRTPASRRDGLRVRMKRAIALYRAVRTPFFAESIGRLRREHTALARRGRS